METAELKTVTRKKVRPLSEGELSAFCGQIALVLGSGLSAPEGVFLMMEDAADGEEKAFLNRIYEEMEASGDFTGTLAETGAFPEYFLSMSRIGEETGTMDKVMDGLSSHYEREDTIRRGIRSTVTYPLVMVTMMVAVIAVLLVKVMPVFNRVFLQLGSEMTGVSRWLMEFGNAISRYSPVLTAVVALFAALVFWCGKTASGTAFAKKTVYFLGLARNLRRDLAACRMADGLHLTLGSGLTQERAMELSASLVEDPETGKLAEAALERIRKGGDLAGTLRDSGLFTGMYARLAAIGEKTGNLDEAMGRIAGLYQEDIDRRLSNLLAVLEPVLVIGICLIVGSILLSVMLPLLGILSGI